MLTSHCNNLSTPHYYIVPCIPSLFRHAILSRPDHATIFPRCCHVFKKKAKAIELHNFAKESGKKDWADKIVASDKGSYYTQHKSEKVVPGSCVVAYV